MNYLIGPYSTISNINDIVHGTVQDSLTRDKNAPELTNDYMANVHWTTQALLAQNVIPHDSDF